jgi:acetate kinase
MRVLVLNCGSSSMKYKLIDTATRKRVEEGEIERMAGDAGCADAVRGVLAELSDDNVEAVGHRVVHGGDRFHAPTLITPEVEAAIEACCPLAPSHNPRNLAAIRAAKAALPDLPHVAVFDTAFHSSLPRRASTYALDPELVGADKRRFGFHGTSHAFVAEEAAEHLHTPLNQLRIVTLHLGNGASACAVEYGRSTETSMGLTPLEGLVMGRRCGDVDPGLVLALIREGRTPDEVETLLGKQSGLAGLSGISNDLRDLQEQAADGHDRARLAISVYAHRARKYIGAYAAAMAGLDAVVLTGGIGENSVSMRRRILQRFEFLGLHLDEERNADARVSDEHRVAEVSAGHSRVRALVVATDEELQIAEQTAKVAGGHTAVGSAGPIPIAISARHVHLDEPTLEALFGPGHELTPLKPLTQPGQFACEERVDLIGPRRTIEGVRIIGPTRGQTQVEISRTDEFHLGVDAPVRASGNLEGSAPITLRGPKGSVELKEGLICSRRHIHMTPADAKTHGVQNGDEVAVELMGGERDLVFRDVLVRVKDSYQLELHLDTDEGNAAEVVPGDEGCLMRIEGTTGRLISRRPTMRLAKLDL